MFKKTGAPEKGVRVADGAENEEQREVVEEPQETEEGKEEAEEVAADEE